MINHSNLFGKRKSRTWSNKIKPFNKDDGETTYVTFQESMKLTLLFGQLLGLNPVDGIGAKQASRLRFEKKSFKYTYSLLICISQGAATFLCWLRLFRENALTLGLTAYIAFYASTCLTTILFIYVAVKWPTLMKHVQVSESIDPCIDKWLKFKINVAAFTILTLALLEHMLSILSKATEIWDCYSDEDFFEMYMEISFPWFNKLRFPNMDTYVSCVFLQSLPSSCWRKMREDFNRLSKLVKSFDDVLNSVIFVSFSNNLYFICLQLFNTLSRKTHNDHPDRACPNYPSGPFNGLEHVIYFSFSLTFLITRFVAVTLFAANVHSSALYASTVLFEVPSTVYGPEVQRFIDQATSDKIALTGLNFFSVTRSLILSVANTIITYELVLLQLNGGTENEVITNSTVVRI